MNKTFKTRVKNLNNSAADWKQKNPVLLLGEIGIENDTRKFKFGDGITAWDKLQYAGTDATQIQDLIDQNEDNTYVVTATGEQEDLVALATIATNPKKGDIGVVKRTIAGDKVSHTAYVYDGTKWEAADGNYNATNVYFDSDLVITASIGVQAPDASGSKTLQTTGKNVKQVFDMIVAQEKNPSITQPSVTLNFTNAGAKEVGTRVTPAYNCSLNAGSYQYGPATGITATSWSVTNSNDDTLTTASGTFTEIQVIESTNYSITATAQHTEGTVPKTNLGNDYSAGKIAAGSKTATKGSITGYRNSFYGTTTNKDVITSATVRGLATKSNKALANGAKFDVVVPVGALRVVIAYPATLRDMSSALDVNGLNAESVTSFKKQEVQVEGANAYTAIAYKVFTLDFANANDKQNTFKITI